MVDPESDSVDDLSQDETEKQPDTDESTESVSDDSRFDPFAALNLPPPVGEDDDSEEESSSEDHGPAISALDAGKKKKTLSEKSESFLASLGIGIEEESEEKQEMAPIDGQNVLRGLPDFDDAASFNDPSVVQLDDPMLIGGRMSSGGFGDTVVGPIGRATSPKLFAQAAQFPTVTQLRCWQWDNGVPVSLGCIDAGATEEDFVEHFLDAMPRKGEGKRQFKIRPIDINGSELGHEATFFISSNHSKLKNLRDDDDDFFGEFNPGGRGNDLGRMYDRILDLNDRKAHELTSSLQDERERLRSIEDERAQERIDMAVNTAQGIQALTERMLQDEQRRAEHALKTQSVQTETMMNTMAQIFGQQQNMQQIAMEQQRRADQLRVDQEQQRSERERLDLEERRRRDREEATDRRDRERREMELKWKEMEDQRRWEREQLRIQVDKEKEEYERKRQEDYLRMQRDIEQQRLRVEQERLQFEQRLSREREEMLLKAKLDREEAERKERLEREYRDREEQRRRDEILLRQQQIESQAQRDKEHQERLMQIASSEREAQRAASERQAQLEREARKNEDKERERRHAMMMKELEMTRQRDREHSEKMFSLQQREIDVKAAGGLDSLLPKAAMVISSLGLEPVDVLRSVLGRGEVGDEAGGDDSGGSWSENLPKILGLVGDVVKMGSGRQAGIPQAMPQAMLGSNAGLDSLMMQQQMVQEEMARMQAMQQPQRQPDLNQYYPPPQQPQQGPVVDVTPPPPQPSTSDLATGAGLALGEQRNARKALRKLVKDLGKSEESTWEEKITSALMNEFNIYNYIVAVTARRAIMEAGSSPDLCEKIVVALQGSSLVPDDLPYGTKETP